MDKIDAMAERLTVGIYADYIQRLDLSPHQMPCTSDRLNPIVESARLNFEDAVSVRQVARRAWRNNHKTGFVNVVYDQQVAAEFLEDAEELGARYKIVLKVARQLERDVIAYQETLAASMPKGHDVKYYAIQATFAELIIEDARASAALLQFT